MSEIMLAISYQEQLAAKDAEIAELRAKLDRCAAAKHAIVEQRDEARECVRRLYQALSPIIGSRIGRDWVWPHTAYETAMENGTGALADTPEHLR